MKRGTSAAFLGLARLAWLRAMPPAAWVLVVLGLVLVRWHETQRGARLAELPGPGELRDGSALVRQSMWSVCALFCLPWCVWRASATFERWRAGELDYLAPRAASRFGLVAATWSGNVLAFAGIAALVAFAAEIATPDGGHESGKSVFREVGTMELPSIGWVTGAAPRMLEFGPRRTTAGTRLSLDFVLGGGNGTATEVVLRTQRGAARVGLGFESHTTIGGRGRAEIELPRGDGPLLLGIALTDPAGRVYLASRTARLFEPATSAREATLAIGLQLLLLAAAACATSLALGAFVGPAIASTATLALWILPVSLDRSPAWLPGLHLASSLDVIARGRVPIGPASSAVIGAFVIVAVALALPALGTVAWRRAT